MWNTLKVGLLLVVLTAGLVAVGHAVGGPTGMVVALVVAAFMNLGTYWFSDKLVIMMTHARPVSELEAPALHAMVARLALRAGIPKPKVYVVDDPSPNAFATGRNPANGVVAVNTGLLGILDEPEVEGVVAHEIAHIRHRDTLTMAIVATIAGAIMVLASFLRYLAIFGGNNRGGNPIVLLVVSLVAPLAAIIVQLAISRAREYEADRLGAQLAGTPRGLASALSKLERGVAAIPGQVPAEAAHLCIVNPFGGTASFLGSLFRTHPSTEDRIRRLMALNLR